MNTHALFKAALEASWQASLVILLILLLRPLLGLRVPASWRSLLWTLVLLRLLVPAFLLPPSPASLQNIAVVDRPFEQAALALGSAGARELAPIQLVRQGPDPDEAPAVSGERATMASRQRTWWWAAAFVWLSGAGCLAMLIAAATFRLQRRVQLDGSAAPEPIERIWRQCCARLSVSHPPRLRVTDCVKSPALIGLWRPALLIPEDTRYSEGDWEHVFTHELAHFRRRDHWTQMLQLLALCAHWFNPLVWIGFRYLRADRELAADEWALRHLEAARSIAYGDTLLKVLAGQAGHASPLCAVGIMEDGGQMKQRLRHIVSFAPRRLVGSVAGIAIVLALASLVLGRPAADLSAYDGLAPAESLVVAARGADQKAVEQLLANGVDVNAVANIRGERTALAAAVAGHAEEIIRLLVVRGADVNLKAEKADAPIIVALKKGWMDTAEFLLSRGAACDAETLAASKGDTAAVQAYLASASPGYDKVKLLGEIAAANGHRELFALLYDALRELPEQRDYFPFSRGTFVNAVARGHRGIIEELLSRDPNLKPREGVNRLAAAAQQTPGMREWLIAQGLSVPEYNNGERLITAAESEDLPEIRRLLAAGVDVHFRGEADWTPLTKAATWGCPRAAKLLLEHGADPNGRRYKIYTTLALAKTADVAALLVAAGAKVRDEDIEYPAGTGSMEMTRWFLDHGVELKRRADRGTALLLDTWAAEIVRLLVERGAEIRARDKTELAKMLDEAPTPEALELVIAAGADVNLRDAQGFAPLIRVLMHGWPAPARQVQTLLKHGADPNARSKDGSGRFPLMFAKDADTIDALINAGADLYAVSDQGLTIVDCVHDHNRPRILAALAKYGVRDDTLMQTYASAGAAVSKLAFAAGRGDLEEIQRQRSAGADINQQSENGYTALHFAVRCGQVAAARWLLEHGANPNRFDAYGLTPARITGTIGSQYIRRGSESESAEATRAMSALFSAQTIDVDFRDEAGETAIMRAASRASHNHAFHLVIATNPNLNLQRHDGMTALMLAVICPPPKDGSVSTVTPPVPPGEKLITYSLQAFIVKQLLERGADVVLRNSAGQTAFDLAQASGNGEILALFRKTSANIQR